MGRFADDADNVSDIDNTCSFTGREYDAETGMYQFRNRYYGAELGRFCERDPAGYVDGQNLYAGYFVPGGMDPSGLARVRCHCEGAVNFLYTQSAHPVIELLDYQTANGTATAANACAHKCWTMRLVSTGSWEYLDAAPDFIDPLVDERFTVTYRAELVTGMVTAPVDAVKATCDALSNMDEDTAEGLLAILSYPPLAIQVFGEDLYNQLQTAHGQGQVFTGAVLATVSPAMLSRLGRILRSLRLGRCMGGGKLGGALPGQWDVDNYPRPPGVDSDWRWGPGSRDSEQGWRWFDPDGGEWRWHGPDSWHSTGHWDYNPWDEWNSRWRNVDSPLDYFGDGPTVTPPIGPQGR